MMLNAPFPYFGGKSAIAAEIWKRLGNVRSYVEPFAGSAAVLLARPDGHRWWESTETINDIDGLVSNFFRAVMSNPEEVAYHAAYPVNENCLHARHGWLVGQKDSLQSCLEGDPDYYDAKIAGWWCWGMCVWIGGEFCSGKGPWKQVDGKLVHLGGGQGINRKRVHLGNDGQGINRKLVHLGDGRGIEKAHRDGINDWMRRLKDRLWRVRVCCGDWSRVLTPAACMEDTGLIGVFLDPPYCVDMDTEILTGRGWKHRAELFPTDEALTLDHEGDGTTRWEHITAIHDFPAEQREMLSMESVEHSSLTTLNHTWPVFRSIRSGKRRTRVPRWATSTTFRSDDCVPITAPHSGFPIIPTHTDALVELVAWFWTEGTLDRQRNGDKGNYGNVCQSTLVNPQNCERITAAFTAEFGPPVKSFPRMGKAPDGIARWRFAIDGHKGVWWFSTGLGGILATHAPNRVPTMAFLRSLTEAQVNLFVDVSMKADGWGSAMAQKDRAATEAFLVAVTLAGKAASFGLHHSGEKCPMWTVRIRKSQAMWPHRLRRVILHDGPVWCVTTPSYTWLARRRGTVWWTGNSAEAGRNNALYRIESATVAHDVREWAIAHGGDPRYRIVLAGYEGEHVLPADWEVVEWKAQGGMGNQAISNENRKRERLWISPYCLKRDRARQMEMSLL